MASGGPLLGAVSAAPGDYGATASPEKSGVPDPHPVANGETHHPNSVPSAPASPPASPLRAPSPGLSFIAVRWRALSRPLSDLLVWWGGIGLCLALLWVALWIWVAYPAAAESPRRMFSVISLGALAFAVACPVLCCVQLVCIEAKLPYFSHWQDATVSKHLLYTGLWGVFFACFGRLLQGWPLNYFDQRAFVVYAVAMSNLALVGAVGIHDKWHALLLLHVVLWAGALGCFAVGGYCLVGYAAGWGARRWDWLLGPLWARVAEDTPIVACAMERRFLCSGWDAPCKFWRRMDPQCPSCPYPISKALACRAAIQADLAQHLTTLTTLFAIGGGLLLAYVAAGAASFYRLVHRLASGPTRAADYRAGYWLACTDIQLLQRALLDLDTRVNDPVAYTMLVEHMVHVKSCYAKDGAEQASLLKGEQRWHFAVVNAGEHTSTGFHWGVGLWDGRQEPHSATIIDPFPEPTAFGPAVPYARQRGILISLQGAGQQHCNWRCGYFALWWALWLDQQPHPPLEALPGILPPMPPQFPSLCWALLQHMTTRRVQLRVAPEFRARVMKGVIDMAELQATEVAK